MEELCSPESKSPNTTVACVDDARRSEKGCRRLSYGFRETDLSPYQASTQTDLDCFLNVGYCILLSYVLTTVPVTAISSAT